MGGSETSYHADTMTDQQTAQATTSPISLIIPCKPEYVVLCRLVAGALGARDSLDEEVIADIKVIVTEACNCFLAMADAVRAGLLVARTEAEQNSADCSIRLDFDSRPDAFVISAFYPERRELISWLERCDAMSEAGLGLTILRSLTDEMVELDTESEGTALRLTKLLPS
jgi:anti-sigma regulatory factor (Ser/Thr protein kinase)